MSGSYLAQKQVIFTVIRHGSGEGIESTPHTSMMNRA